jgi:flagellar biosynthesis regulator FlbT
MFCVFRTRLLNQIAAQLMAIASDFQVAVVLMNQMTTKLDSGIIQNESLSVRLFYFIQIRTRIF